MIFHFKSFPGKTNNNFLNKTRKTQFWGFLGPFLPQNKDVQMDGSMYEQVLIYGPMTMILSLNLVCDQKILLLEHYSHFRQIWRILNLLLELLKQILRK